jgi:hypothetical protein
LALNQPRGQMTASALFSSAWMFARAAAALAVSPRRPRPRAMPHLQEQKPARETQEKIPRTALTTLLNKPRTKLRGQLRPLLESPAAANPIFPSSMLKNRSPSFTRSLPAPERTSLEKFCSAGTAPIPQL